MAILTGDTRIEIESAIQHVQRILLVEHRASGFERIKWQIDEGLRLVTPAIPPPELLQLLNNLLSNSVKNLLQQNIQSPLIKISSHPCDASQTEFSISDNGTGLSLDRFESLTGLPVAA